MGEEKLDIRLSVPWKEFMPRHGAIEARPRGIVEWAARAARVGQLLDVTDVYQKLEKTTGMGRLRAHFMREPDGRGHHSSTGPGFS